MKLHVRAAAVVAVLAAAAVIPSCSSEDAECTSDADCGPGGECTQVACVDGACVGTPAPDGPPPSAVEGDRAGDCTAQLCDGGRLVPVADPTDAGADREPRDCSVPDCVPGTSSPGIQHVPDGSACRIAWQLEGACLEGQCRLEPPDLCRDHCALCGAPPSCPTCDADRCEQLCAETLRGPCSDVVAARIACDVGSECSRDIPTCEAERAAEFECQSACSGLTCQGCACEQTCDGRLLATRCEFLPPPEQGVRCECLVDDAVVDTCFEVDGGCYGSCCFTSLRPRF